MTLILTTILFLITLQGILSKPLDDSDVGLTPIQMIENHGYPAETHHITTEDGYILTFYRIPHGLNDDGSAERPAVFLMHGLISSSADFLNMGPDHSLGYILADLGYDVWLGNARGNDWSRNHTTLDLSNSDDAIKFYDFSWHEIGYYDLPAAIDHILEVNGGDSLYYVGHSQGCTSFFVLASTRPEYNDKIKIASLMGPASSMDHQSKPVLQVLSKYIYELEDLLVKYKLYDLPSTANLQAGAFAVCTLTENYDFCIDIIGLVDGRDAPELEQSEFALILSNAPSNIATKQLLHYGQLIKNGGFSQYDHRDKNLDIYGSETPPAYDLSKITAPVALYYGKNDGLVNYEDVQSVVKTLSNVADDYLVDYELFNHIDFLFAKDVTDLVYAELIKVMQDY